MPLEPPTIRTVLPVKSVSFIRKFPWLEGSADAAQGALEQADGLGVEEIPGFARRLAGAGAGVRAFEDDAELVAGEHRVPVGGRQVAGGARPVVLDQFVDGREALPRTDGDVLDLGLVAFRPGRDQPTEVDQRVADGGQLPVDDG